MIISNFVLNYALYLLHPFITKKHGPGHKGGKKEVRRQQNVDWWPKMNFLFQHAICFEIVVEFYVML